MEFLHTFQIQKEKDFEIFEVGQVYLFFNSFHSQLYGHIYKV